MVSCFKGWLWLRIFGRDFERFGHQLLTQKGGKREIEGLDDNKLTCFAESPMSFKSSSCNRKYKKLIYKPKQPWTSHWKTKSGDKFNITYNLRHAILWHIC